VPGHAPRSNRRVPLLVIACVSLLSAQVLWALRTGNGALRAQLAVVTTWFLGATVLLIVGSLHGLRHRIVALLASITRGHRTALVCLALSSVLLTVVVAPRTNRIFYDEDIYQDQAQNIAALGRAQLCDEGRTEFGNLECLRWEYNKWPSGYPYLLSILYRLFGVKELWAFVLNNLAVLSTAMILYLTCSIAFPGSVANLFATAAFIAIPMNASWGNSAAVEPTAATASAATVLAWFFAIRQESDGSLMLATAVTVLAMQFRIESVLVAPVALVTVLLNRPAMLGRAGFWKVILVGVLLSTPLVGHFLAVSGERWGAGEEARFSTKYLLSNLAPNTLLYLQNRRFPALVTVFAILGAVPRRDWRNQAVVTIWFLLFWGVFLSFYAGSYSYGADIRYSLVSYAPLCVLAGLGIDRTLGFFQSASSRNAAQKVIGAALLVSTIGFLPLIRSTGEEAWAARVDHGFSKEIARYLPENSLVFTQTTGTFLLDGRNAAQMSIAADEPDEAIREFFKRYAGGVFLHWNFWCNTSDDAQVALCGKALDRFDARIVLRRTFWSADYRLYRLSGLRSLKAPEGDAKGERCDRIPGSDLRSPVWKIPQDFRRPGAAAPVRPDDHA